jgi:diguanylate cyclase (GGDEF)-like protein
MLAGAARLARLALERALSEARLAEQARHDSLTGLANRRAFLHAAVRAVGRSPRTAEAMVLFIDLDRFKSVNDSLGHDVGDKLLVEVARRIQSVVRPTDVAARLGGDEYAVLCEDLTAIEGLEVADRISYAIGAPIAVEGGEVLVTASIGVAFNVSSVTAQALIERADAAMYRAKERGRNRVEVFDQDLREQALARLTMRTTLHRAVERHEFRLLYQPVVAVATGQILGAEALVRWDTPGGQLVPPETFIDAAEESGLIVPLGLQVLEEACRQAIRWRSTAIRPFTVSVNLSPRQVADTNVVQDIARVIHDTGVDPTSVIFEITEGTLMEAAESTSTLQRLKALGVGLTVDDFGTGYSSLSYLKRFPVDGLKVDQSFINGLGVDPEDSAIVAAVINLAHTLGLCAVAEGVETSAQLRALQQLGCEAAQGFYLGRPGPPEQLSLLL